MFSKLFRPKKASYALQTKVEKALAKYTSNLFPVGLAKVVSNLHIKQQDNGLKLSGDMPFPFASEAEAIVQHLTTKLECAIELNFICQIEPIFQHEVAGVKNIIAVNSGKGGVGKSTTTVNLAYALKALGLKVGVLDADVHGPSMPTMLGLDGQHPMSPDGKHLLPIEKNGIAVMSSGFLADDDGTRIWKGSISSNAFEQMFKETIWGDLDVLLIDMPPGTGDIQLTLVQRIPAVTSVIVTTPQDVALLDVQKGLNMFKRLNLPVLGMIENMSYHVCPNCQNQAHIFGDCGGEAYAKQVDLPLLGKLPLHIDVRQAADKGQSIQDSAPDSQLAIAYRQLAEQVCAQQYYQFDSRAPKS
ncbi:iron-sulfur cluster carrier protein ApbC [Saccharobesus litoralis]|nr:iron-sulfur cluster carrier protein ApbC [Saccharobesus litoralis]